MVGARTGKSRTDVADATTQNSLRSWLWLPHDAWLSPNPDNFGRVNVPSCRLYDRIRLRGSLASFDWHALASVATWLMTLIIQRAEHRDTQAIQAKLDELLRAEGRARSELTELDDEEPEVIEERRLRERRAPARSR